MDPYSTGSSVSSWITGYQVPQGKPVSPPHNPSFLTGCHLANSVEVGTPAFLGQNVCPILRHPQGGRRCLEMRPLDVIGWPGALHG